MIQKRLRNTQIRYWIHSAIEEAARFLDFMATLLTTLGVVTMLIAIIGRSDPLDDRMFDGGLASVLIGACISLGATAGHRFSVWFMLWFGDDVVGEDGKDGQT